MSQSIISADTGFFTSMVGASSSWMKSTAWSNARGTGTGQQTGSLYAGIEYSYFWFMHSYSIKRCALRFDTSSLAGKTITSAYLQMALSAENIASGTPQFDIVKPSFQSDWVSDPASYIDEIYDAILSGTYSNYWYQFGDAPTLNQYYQSQGLTTSHIDTSGYTYLGVLANADRANSSISVRQDIVIYPPGHSTYPPKLIVNYEDATQPTGDLMFWFF